MIDFSSKGFNSLILMSFSLFIDSQISWTKLSFINVFIYSSEKIPEILPSSETENYGNSNWFVIGFLRITFTQPFSATKSNLSLFNWVIPLILLSSVLTVADDKFVFEVLNVIDNGWLGIDAKGLKMMVYPFPVHVARG